jgi:hypothetical protein
MKPEPEDYFINQRERALLSEIDQLSHELNAACGFAFDVGRDSVKYAHWEWILGCCLECEADLPVEERCTREKPSCHRHTDS